MFSDTFPLHLNIIFFCGMGSFRYGLFYWVPLILYLFY